MERARGDPPPALLVAVAVITLTVAGALGWALADRGGDPEGGGRTGGGRASPTVDTGTGTGFRFDAQVQAGTMFGSFVAAGEVSDERHWRLVTFADGVVIEQVRFDGLLYERAADSETALESASWSVTDYVEIEDQYRAIAESDLLPGISEQVLAAATFNTFVELAFFEPAVVVDLALANRPRPSVGGAAGERTFVAAPPLPPELATAYADLGVEPPSLELEVALDRKRRPERVRVEIAAGNELFVAEARIRDRGDVVVAEPDGAVAPGEAPPTAPPAGGAPDDDTATAIAAVGVDLMAPSLPELILLSVDALTADETVEGCPQVRLVYETPGFGFLDVFLLPRACAEAFAPAPFDQTLGGHPSRFDGYEVLVGDTVVQLVSSLSPADLEAVAASLSPITAEELLLQID